MPGRRVLVVVSGLILCASGCGTDPSAGTPDPAPDTDDIDVPAPVSTTTTTVELRPLLASNPLADVVVDGAVVDRLEMRFDEWNGERQEPADRSPSTGLVVAAGSTVELLRGDARAVEGDVVRLADTSRFALEHQVSGEAGIPVPFPEIGLYAISARFEFGPSDAYSGAGALWAATWVQVAAPDGGCLASGPGPAVVAALVDDAGCPADTTATLELESVLPWFHCAPWPPRITWHGHPYADAEVVGFDRVDVDTRSVAIVDPPDDAEPAGFRLPAGPILVAPSDPDALFVELPDGTAERWAPPPVDYGCA